jgi:serine/threonine protein kinase
MAELINKRYRIKQQLGEGGMGKTFLALDQKNGKQVVIKRLCLKTVNEWKAVELFEREARTLKNIDHPFIPEYLDYFTRSKDGDTEYYLVQEYIEGGNLAGQVKAGKRFTEEQVFDIAEKLLSILSYLQGLRPPLVHRDINPKNIIINRNNDVWLVDFGAALGAAKGAGSGGTTVVGTYGYMPMEQLMGKASPASDIYALGMTLIYLLSHMNPQDFPIKNMKVIYRNLIKISARRGRFIDRLIEPDPVKRLPDAKTALSLLEKLKQGETLDDDRYAAVIDLHNLLPPFKSRIRFEKRDEELIIAIPGKFIRNLPLLVFLAFWFFFVIGWGVIASRNGFGLTVFSVPFWLGGLVQLVKLVNGLSTCTLSLTPDIVAVKNGILRLKKTLPLEKISNITKTIFKRKYKNISDLNTAHGIKMEAGAKTILIDKFLTESEAQWIAQVVQEYKAVYS